MGMNSRVRVEQIPEAGHGLPYDQPERLVAVTKSFLAERLDKGALSQTSSAPALNRA